MSISFSSQDHLQKVVLNMFVFSISSHVSHFRSFHFIIFVNSKRPIIFFDEASFGMSSELFYYNYSNFVKSHHIPSSLKSASQNLLLTCSFPLAITHVRTFYSISFGLLSSFNGSVISSIHAYLERSLNNFTRFLHPNIVIKVH